MSSCGALCELSVLAVVGKTLTGRALNHLSFQCILHVILF